MNILLDSLSRGYQSLTKDIIERNKDTAKFMMYSKFDGVLAMYHDQGLAPFKTIAMESGVNYTAGLPFVRTSPDHGTGYDIAGKNEADESSFREAIYRAIDIYRNRAIYSEITSNPLRRQYVNKGSDNVVLDLTKVEDEDTH